MGSGERARSKRPDIKYNFTPRYATVRTALVCFEGFQPGQPDKTIEIKVELKKTKETYWDENPYDSDDDEMYIEIAYSAKYTTIDGVDIERFGLKAGSDSLRLGNALTS